MDAVKYLKTLRRMCNCECSECELGKRLGVLDTCALWQKANPEEAVAILEQWAKEHPVKTRQSEFLTMFPGADVGETDGCLTLNPCHFYKKMQLECSGRKCSDCRKAFWLAEVK